MKTIVFLILSMLFINIANCLTQIFNFYINSKPNDSDSFYQDDRQNQVNIFVININGKDVDIRKLFKLNDADTVEPVLNVNNTEPTSNQTVTNASEVTTMSTTTTTVENKDKEIEKELKVPDDYTLYTGHGYYKYHNNNGANWTQAKDICVKEGAHLPVINSEAEADLLIGIKKTKKNGFSIPVGLYRTSTDSKLVTVLGGRLNETGYTKWSSGYPTTTSGYDCGRMEYDGTLFNGLCSLFERPFICEK